MMVFTVTFPVVLFHFTVCKPILCWKIIWDNWFIGESFAEVSDDVSSLIASSKTE